jgi:hypothetical protein
VVNNTSHHCILSRNKKTGHKYSPKSDSLPISDDIVPVNAHIVSRRKLDKLDRLPILVGIDATVFRKIQLKRFHAAISIRVESPIYAMNLLYVIAH